MTQCVIKNRCQVDTSLTGHGPNIFLVIQGIILLIRRVLAPLVLLIAHCTGPLKKRLYFEMLNDSDPFSRSFLSDGHKADYLFEVSSEGEWEQIVELVEYLISIHKRVEILYSSDALESRIHRFVETTKLVRILRVPYFFPWSLETWISAKVICFCRYDFLPELIFLKSRNDVSFVLFSATLKNKDQSLKSPVKRWYLTNLYRLFDQIFSATEQDYQKIARMAGFSSQITEFEFRHQRIISRVSNAHQVLGQQSELNDFWNRIQQFPKNKRLIMGSCWPSEMKLFANPEIEGLIKNQELVVVLAPHKLSEEFIADIEYQFKQASTIPLVKVGGMNAEKLTSSTGVYLLQQKGILCEAYSLFGAAYVGGGFNRSIHSVLEPFWAGCLVFVGPKIHRSTEYDYIVENSREDISVVSDLNMLPKLLMDSDSNCEVRSVKRRKAAELYVQKGGIIIQSFVQQFK